MSSVSYSIDISHEGLHAYRRITGRDKYVVEAKAAAQRAVWDEKWAKLQQRDKRFIRRNRRRMRQRNELRRRSMPSLRLRTCSSAV